MRKKEEKAINPAKDPTKTIADYKNARNDAYQLLPTEIFFRGTGSCLSSFLKVRYHG
jgi:hypothetical protein